MAKKKEIKVASTEAEQAVVPTKQTDAEKKGLRGPVKRTKSIFYKAFLMNGKVIQGKEDKEHAYFNSSVTIYNEMGGKIEQQRFHEDGGSFIQYFDDEGRGKGYKDIKADGTCDRYSTVELNSDGKLIVMNHFENDPKSNSRSVFIYNEKGLCSEYISYYLPIEEVYQKHLQKYDEKGFRNDLKIYDRENNLTMWVAYVNNDKGHAIEETRFNPKDGSIEKHETKDYTYNEEGRMIGCNGAVYLPDGYGETYEYENDDYGNWVKKIIFLKEKVINIVHRDITYYGEKAHDKLSTNEQSEIDSLLLNDKELPTTNVMDEKKEIKQEKLFLKMGEEETKWLAAGSLTPDVFNAMRYYVLKNNVMPSEMMYSGKSFEVMALMQLLQENLGGEVVHTYSNKTEQKDATLLRYTMSFPGNEYMIQATQIVQDKANKYVVPQFIESSMLGNSGYVYISPVLLFHPSDESGKRDDDFEEKFKDFLEVCTLDKQPDKPVIYMVQMAGNAYSMKVHSVDDNFEIADLDLNYGPGFDKFHNDLMKRFKDESKGLVLFHGQPGTGKTYYIRHLLRTMASKKKIVIYMPPNMVDHLVEPDFMTFISNSVENYSKQGNFCVLLIEDAEPLLAQRHSETRIQGITNLLNMTDGLLNDMLNLQIICTFNVDVEKLDKALLRPGRLIARKEFSALPEFEANLLGSRLGITYRFTKPASLSEIYSRMKDKNTLIHDL